MRPTEPQTNESFMQRHEREEVEKMQRRSNALYAYWQERRARERGEAAYAEGLRIAASFYSNLT